MPSTTTATLLLLLAVVGFSAAQQQPTSMSPECQQIFQSYNTGQCATALNNGLQQTSDASKAANGTISPDAVQKSIDSISAALQQYCSDQCIASFNDYYTQMTTKCGQTDQNSQTYYLGTRNLLCGVDKTTKKNCFVENLNILKPVMQQNSTAASAIIGGGADNDNSTTGTMDSPLITDAVLAQPKEVVCTPCYQYEVQQQALFLKRLAGFAGPMQPNNTALAQQQDMMAKLNAKCGDNWVTMDDSRYVLGSQSVPTTGGNSTGQPDVANTTNTANTTGNTNAGSNKSNAATTLHAATATLMTTLLVAIAVAFSAV
ncbi:hypothetical protein RI367_005030 [Sorochytrium milnesiophthora]